MATERIQRRIERLLDQVEEARPFSNLRRVAVVEALGRSWSVAWAARDRHRVITGNGV